LIPLIKAFSILPLIISISNVAGMLILLPLGMENLVSRILLLVAILNLFVFIPFVYYLNALGAVWASLIVEFTVALVLSYAVYLKLYLPIKSRILN
jgi:O-antigen/teichoic acid export membrane protein